MKFNEIGTVAQEMQDYIGEDEYVKSRNKESLAYVCKVQIENVRTQIDLGQRLEVSA